MSSAITRNNTAEFVNTSGDTMTGPLLLPDGSTGAPSIGFASDADGTGTGFYRLVANNIGVSANGTAYMRFNTAGIELASSGQYSFSSTASPGTAPDTGLARASAGVVRVTDGAAGLGSIQTGGMQAAIVTKTANYTATANDYTILCDTSAGSIAITLPPAASHTGRIYIIKKISADANAVQINGDGADTIDGLAAISTTTAQWSGRAIQSTGTGWVRIFNY